MTSLPVARTQDSPRDLGAPPSTVIKVLMGGGLILLSIALLWGPLIVISAIQQGSQPNPPVSFRASLTISGFPVSMWVYVLAVMYLRTCMCVQ